MLSSKVLTHVVSPRYIVSRGLAAQAGTVKFYLRDKGYGFIQPDSNPDTDVFVHRNGIDCSHEIPADVRENSQRYPYLKKDERVLFEIDYETATGLRKARNVVWLNGTKIPPERKNYLGGVYERAQRILGEELYKVLSNPDSVDDASLLQEVKTHFSNAQTSIQTGEEIIRRLGMNVEDFPTIKSRQGRGRYKFTEEEEETSITSSLGSGQPFQETSIEDELSKLAGQREKETEEHETEVKDAEAKETEEKLF